MFPTIFRTFNLKKNVKFLQQIEFTINYVYPLILPETLTILHYPGWCGWWHFPSLWNCQWKCNYKQSLGVSVSVRVKISVSVSGNVNKSKSVSEKDSSFVSVRVTVCEIRLKLQLQV